MVSQIYPSELQINKANTTDTGASFLDMHFSISNDIIHTNNMINVTILILKLSISHFAMSSFLVLHLMEFIFLIPSGLPEHLVILHSSTHTINF